MTISPSWLLNPSSISTSLPHKICENRFFKLYRETFIFWYFFVPIKSKCHFDNDTHKWQPYFWLQSFTMMRIWHRYAPMWISRGKMYVLLWKEYFFRWLGLNKYVILKLDYLNIQTMNPWVHLYHNIMPLLNILCGESKKLSK